RPFFRRECLQCVEEIVCHLISQRVEAYQAKEPTPNANGSVRPARPSKLARILSAGLHRAARSFAFEVLECKFKFKARVCATSSKWLSDRLTRQVRTACCKRAGMTIADFGLRIAD